MTTFFQLADALQKPANGCLERMIEMPGRIRPTTPQSALLLNPIAHLSQPAPRRTPWAANDNRPSLIRIS